MASRSHGRVVGTVIAKRLLIVTGKGGVGKSTVAAALGVAGARQGRRTLVAEVSGRTDAAELLDVVAGEPLTETRVAPSLHHVTIERQAVVGEYLREEVPGPFPAGVLTRSHAFGVFVAAAPGMQELLTIGKAWELTQHPRRRKGSRPYDMVVLDAPATGQLVGLLEAPATFAGIARAGPVSRQATAINRMLRDRQTTGLLAVVAPEQMAVTETLELRDSVRSKLGLELDAVIVNRSFPARFTATEVAALSPVATDPAARSARWMYERARAQQAQTTRLRRRLDGVRRVRLPYLFTETFDRHCVERLADTLGGALT